MVAAAPSEPRSAAQPAASRNRPVAPEVPPWLVYGLPQRLRSCPSSRPARPAFYYHIRRMHRIRAGLVSGRRSSSSVTAQPKRTLAQGLKLDAGLGACGRGWAALNRKSSTWKILAMDVELMGRAFCFVRGVCGGRGGALRPSAGSDGRQTSDRQDLLDGVSD